MKTIKDLKSLREDYTSMTLDEKEVLANPFRQIALWLQQAMDAKLPEPNAMTLATADLQGIPSARVVLLKEVDEKGLVFFTNYQSLKGRQLEQNPYASVVFNWLELQRQLRVDGIVEKLSVDESKEYFHQRPRASQLGAVASPQSTFIPDRDFLDALFRDVEQKFEGKTVEMPQHWGGYRLLPTAFEFWQGRTNRLHDRVVYILDAGNWAILRLAP